MAATFLDLPTEVIILTLCHLPLRELVACKRLCRRFHALIEQSQLLQYHFRIMRSGVEDLFVPGICSSEFLKSLEQWEMAWWKLDIGEHFARHRYHNILWTVEHIVQNGHIAAMRLGDSSWHTAPGWSYADISRVLLQGDGIPQGDSWKDIQLDRSITPKGYVLDISQDLVAVVYYRDTLWRQMQIRFLRFTTGLPHDLASKVVPELELKCKSSSDCEITMEIMGPYLFMIVAYKTRLRMSGRHQRIYFVDWTKGHIHCVRQVRGGTYFPVIAFLSKNLIVLARKRDFSLEVCKIPEGEDNSTFTLQTVCVLRLPSIHPSTRVRFHIRNRTPLTDDSFTPALHSHQLPFRSSPADAILGFEINVRRYARPGSEARRLAFWVHHSTLRKYAMEAGMKHSRVLPTPKSLRSVRVFASRLINRIGHTFASPTVRQWQEWGPQSTRWYECSDDLRDRQTLAGSRCAIVQQGLLTLMDFSPGRLAVLGAQGPCKNPAVKAVLDPTTIRGGRSFLHDITSKLPYCESTKEDVKSRILIDDEWVIQFEEEGLFGWEGYIDFHSVLPTENSCKA
ncbi:hypothetical protein BJV78DRAFT_1223462 [Lactifluus subvellereus]|nr:hypothetical protein BJV78DRAFT_1223462 [Lactifluus subvellereus]